MDEYGKGNDSFGENLEMLDFMLRNILVGKEEEDIRSSITTIWELLGNVLYPNPVKELDPIQDANEARWSPVGALAGIYIFAGHPMIWQTGPPAVLLNAVE